MDNIFFFSFLISFVITFYLMLFLIPIFRKVHLGQYIRKEGPRKHESKKGTPILGGVFIFIASFITFLFINYEYSMLELDIIIVLYFPLFIYMLVGLIDDLFKLIKKENEGLKAKTKLLLQFISILLYFIVLKKFNILDTKIYLFRTIIDIKYFYIVLLILIFLSSSNALNLSDGIDGLAGGLMIITLIAYGIIAFLLKEGIILISIITLLASVLAFFIFNVNPARIFMGDSGSMMLGAALAMYAVLLKVELLLFVLALPYIIETLSVIIQVIYFKITKGKRLLLMSPLHHHFELKGYSEWKIDIIFWILGIISSIISIVFVCLR